MDLPTEEELRSDPRGSLGRILAIRRTVEEAETSAIAFLIGRGWSMSNVGWMLGRSRQAVSQRMQRSLVTSMPHAELRDAGRVRREASRREQLLDSDSRTVGSTRRPQGASDTTTSTTLPAQTCSRPQTWSSRSTLVTACPSARCRTSRTPSTISASRNGAGSTSVVFTNAKPFAVLCREDSTQHHRRLP